MKLRKAFKIFSKDFKKAYKKAFKKNKYITVSFPLDARYECCFFKEETSKYDQMVVVLRKDCASFTKNGDYHLIRRYTSLDYSIGYAFVKLDRDKILEDVLKHISNYPCDCKKNQKAKAKSMISKAKRVNGRWIY